MKQDRSKFLKGDIMINVCKYDNLESELPKLQKVLRDAIQSDFLEIKSVEISCDKFQDVCKVNPVLCTASFVIFSKYIKKSEHKYEEFIFLDHEGHEVCHISGKEMELYGLLGPCMNLELSQEYQVNHSDTCSIDSHKSKHFVKH